MQRGALMTLGKKILVGLGLAFIVLQLLPFGRDHQNPSTNIEPTWKSPEDRALVERACFDCHSNQTKWPWYSNVAPVSWFLQSDVERGRKNLNFSEWNQAQPHLFNAVDVIDEGRMPLPMYIRMHSEAKLTAAEKEKLENILSDIYIESLK
jgi:hypothetical protein